MYGRVPRNDSCLFAGSRHISPLFRQIVSTHENHCQSEELPKDDKPEASAGGGGSGLLTSINGIRTMRTLPAHYPGHGNLARNLVRGIGRTRQICQRSVAGRLRLGADAHHNQREHNDTRALTEARAHPRTRGPPTCSLVKTLPTTQPVDPALRLRPSPKKVPRTSAYISPAPHTICPTRVGSSCITPARNFSDRRSKRPTVRELTGPGCGKPPWPGLSLPQKTGSGWACLKLSNINNALWHCWPPACGPGGWPPPWAR